MNILQNKYTHTKHSLVYTGSLTELMVSVNISVDELSVDIRDCSDVTKFATVI